MSGKLRPHGLSSVQTGQVNFCINPNILTYNAQFNFCFPTIKTIPSQGFLSGVSALNAPNLHPDLEPNFQRTRPLFAAGWGPYQTSSTGQPTFASHTKLFLAHSAQSAQPSSHHRDHRKSATVLPTQRYPQRTRSTPTAKAGSDRAANHTCQKTTVKHPKRNYSIRSRSRLKPLCKRLIQIQIEPLSE